MATITVNGHKFVETKKEFIDTLFHTGGTATGFFKTRKRAILLFDHKEQPLAMINQELVLGNARKMDDGKVWYTYMPSNHPLYNESILNQTEQFYALTKGRDHNGFYFK